MRVSVVIPLRDEADNVDPLIRTVREALSREDYELILVDDGSRDGTIREVKRLADGRTRALALSRNFGQTSALAAGIDAAQGAYVVTMDGDLQNDPHDIPMLIAELEAGDWDVVAGRRAHRQDRWLSRKLPSRMANLLIGRLTGVTLSDYGCTLKAFRADIAKDLGLYGELHRFIPVLATMRGARIKEVSVRHRPRLNGTSKYGIGRAIRVVSDLALMLFFQRYGAKPMHLFGPLGFLALGAGGLIDVYMVFLKGMGEDIGTRPLLFMGILLTVVGFQLITTGFLAEVMMRTYYESQSKRPYAVKERFSGTGSPSAPQPAHEEPATGKDFVQSRPVPAEKGKAGDRAGLAALGRAGD